MFMKQEPKYGINAALQLVNRATGIPIPDSEPVMIFRAKDTLAASGAILPYLSQCLALGLTAHAAVVQNRLDDFERFAAEHPELMKQPDSAPAEATRQSDLGFEVLERGYLYRLTGGAVIPFVKPGPSGDLLPGTTTEELLAVLMDRVTAQNDRLPCQESKDILLHLTAALTQQRARMDRMNSTIKDLNTVAETIKAELPPGTIEEFGIWMAPVTSSNVLAMGYDHIKSVLALKFKSGAIYHYQNVPSTIFDALSKAESVGAYASAYITRGQYEGRRVNEPDRAIAA